MRFLCWINFSILGFLHTWATALKPLLITLGDLGTYFCRWLIHFCSPVQAAGALSIKIGMTPWPKLISWCLCSRVKNLVDLDPFWEQTHRRSYWHIHLLLLYYFLQIDYTTWSMLLLLGGSFIVFCFICFLLVYLFFILFAFCVSSFLKIICFCSSFFCCKYNIAFMYQNYLSWCLVNLLNDLSCYCHLIFTSWCFNLNYI